MPSSDDSGNRMEHLEVGGVQIPFQPSRAKSEQSTWHVQIPDEVNEEHIVDVRMVVSIDGEETTVGGQANSPGLFTFIADGDSRAE